MSTKPGEDQLDPTAYLRVHRSYIVRRDRISAVRYARGGWRLTLEDGRATPVGRSYLPRLKGVVPMRRPPS